MARKARRSSLRARSATPNRWVPTQGAKLPAPETAVVGARERAVQPDARFLSVQCWCERHSVWVPQHWARGGVTLSCGAEKCVSPTGDRMTGERVPKGSTGYLR